MRIAQPSTVLAFLPLYIAIENSEHEVLTFGDPKAAIEAVVKKQADLAIGDPFIFDYLNYEENKVIIVAGLIRKITFTLITFNPFIQEATKKTFSGKIIVSYPEPSTTFFLARKLKDEYKFAAIIETPFNTELRPLLTQEADLAIVIEPNTTYAIRNGARKLLDFFDTIAVLTGFSTTKNFAIKKQKELKELFAKVKYGVQKFYSDENLTLLIAKKYFPMVEESVLREAIANLRKSQVYCPDLQFTDEEIKAGLELRRINLPLKKVKEFIRY